MRLEDIDDELRMLSFVFFYWFSRFEFALKENNFLKDKNAGANAEPDWDAFNECFKSKYIASEEAKKLIELHPKRQIVANAGGLEWRPIGLNHCNNDLCKIITMLKTVRNNLFHGGKHGDNDVDSKERNRQLLSIGKTILDQLAKLSGFDSDYTRYY